MATPRKQQQRCSVIIYDKFYDQHQCPNRAAAASAFCRVHDPELKAKREAARVAKNGPGKWAKEKLVRKLLTDFLKARLTPEDAETADRLAWHGYSGIGSIPWPVELLLKTSKKPTEPDA